LWQSVSRIASGASRFLRLPRRELLAVIGLAALTFAVTLTVMLSRAAADTRARAAELRREEQRTAVVPLLSAAELSLAPGDFILPDAPASPTAAWVPWRPRAPRWTAEMAAPYWVDPKLVAAEILAAQDDRAMDSLFEKVP
jgi:hypothetical protein